MNADEPQIYRDGNADDADLADLHGYELRFNHRRDIFITIEILISRRQYVPAQQKHIKIENHRVHRGHRENNNAL